MTRFSAEHFRTASRLLFWALKPKQRPSGNREYADLVRQYQESALVQEALEVLVAEQSMVLLDVDAADGVMLAADRQSPYAFTVADMRSRAGNKVAAVLATVMAAIAAAFFPTSDSIEDDENPLPTQRPSEILDVLLGAIEEKERLAKAGELPDDVNHIWRELARMPAEAERREDAKRDRPNLSSLEGTIFALLKHMSDNDLITAPDGNNVIQARERFRRQLKRHGSLVLLKVVQDSANTQSAE